MTSGFCDNGAGTAGVLELARIFAQANASGLLKPKYTILFIPFTDEELILVGSINYVIRHEAEMGKFIAVLNLDCIGNDDVYISETDSGPKFDLDQLVYKAAQDLGIAAAFIFPGGSDQEVFRRPSRANDLLQRCWGISAGIADATRVESSILLISLPLDWIHTPYDNSTSTITFDWVEPADLENHLKVTALSITRIVAPMLCDINYDGVVDMTDIGTFASAFGATPSSPKWKSECDMTGMTYLVPDGKIDMRDITAAARRFEHKDI